MGMQNLALQFSFAGGIIDRALHNRTDWAKRDMAVADILNGIVKSTGGSVKRGGLRFVWHCIHDDKPVTLVEFEFSTDQTYMLEFGDYIMRVFTADFGLVLNADGTEYRCKTPFSALQMQEMRYVQDRDALFCVHNFVTPQQLTRHGHADWRWAPMFIEADRILSPTGLMFLSSTTDGHNGVEYAVTSYREISGNREESLGYPTLRSDPDTADIIGQEPARNLQSIHLWYETYTEKYVGHPDFPTIPDPIDFRKVEFDNSPPQLAIVNTSTWEFGPVTNSPTNMNVKISAVFAALYGTPCNGAWGYTSSGGFRGWNVNKKKYPGENPQLGWYDKSSYPGYHSGNNSWYMKHLAMNAINNGIKVGGYGIDDAYKPVMDFIKKYNDENGIKLTNQFKWDGIPEAKGYYIYRRSIDSDDPNYYRIADVPASQTQFLDNLEETQLQPLNPVKGENKFTNPEDFPGVVAIHQQRIMFGRTLKNPSSIFASHTGIYTDFSINPSDDSAGLEFRLSSLQLNAVQDIIALRKLMALTSGDEFINDASGAITGKNINMVPQSSSRASSIPAIIVDNLAIRVPRDRRSITSLGYALQQEGFEEKDLISYSRDLLAGHNIVGIAYQRRPHFLIWVVLSDGSLLSCTFIPSEQFQSWTRHETQGKVLSIKTLTTKDGSEELWLVIQRTLGDGTRRQYIEVLQDPLPYEDKGKVEKSFYVDSGLSMESTDPKSTVRGLEHLEGLTVSILADGNVHPQRVVTNGEVTLDQPARVVHVGLPYRFYLKTLDLELSTVPTLRNVRRRPSKSFAEVYQCRELWYRANDGPRRPLMEYKGQAFGLVPEPLTDDFPLDCRAAHTRGTYIEFESESPVPCGLLNVGMEIPYGSS